MYSKYFLKLTAIFTFILFSNLSAFSQVTLSQVGPPKETFIKLKNDSIITGENIDLEFGVGNRIETITLDGKIYKSRNVSSYGFAGVDLFATSKYFMKGVYMKCYGYGGKINFFQTYAYGSRGTGVSGIHNYYSVGLGEVKKLKTKNLIKDITGNYEAMQEIKKANKLRKATFISLGAAVLIGCTAGKLGSAAIIGSFSCVGLGTIFTIVKREKVKKSISYYTNGTFDPYYKGPKDDTPNRNYFHAPPKQLNKEPKKSADW